LKFDKLVKSPKLRHAPAFAGAGSAKAGIQNYLKTLDSRLRGNDAKGRFKTFYETIYFEIKQNITRERLKQMEVLYDKKTVQH
jgi:Ca2+-binding EF-hand superfamily protein